MVIPAELDPATGRVVRQAEEWMCPQGITCRVGSSVRSYDGHVWHNNATAYPLQRDIYLCVNDGCPDEGAPAMVCKHGSHAFFFFSTKFNTCLQRNSRQNCD